MTETQKGSLLADTALTIAISCLSLLCFSERSFFSICTHWSNLMALFSCTLEVRWMWGEWGFCQAAASVDSRAYPPLEMPNPRNNMAKLLLCHRTTHRMTCWWHSVVIIADMIPMSSGVITIQLLLCKCQNITISKTHKIKYFCFKS